VVRVFILLKKHYSKRDRENHRAYLYDIWKEMREKSTRTHSDSAVHNSFKIQTHF
jgi:hypothetical protein